MWKYKNSSFCHFFKSFVAFIVGINIVRVNIHARFLPESISSVATSYSIAEFRFVFANKNYLFYGKVYMRRTVSYLWRLFSKRKCNGTMYKPISGEDGVWIDTFSYQEHWIELCFWSHWFFCPRTLAKRKSFLCRNYYVFYMFLSDIQVMRSRFKE